MFGTPRPGPPPKCQVGMVDPYVNEVVTHVAELDEDAMRRQSRNAILPFLCVTLAFPSFWMLACIVWCWNERKTTSTIRGTQVYLTEHTLVYVIANHSIILSSRVTIPLSNIASVMVQSGVMTVNIKPTTSEVMLNIKYTTGGQHSSTGTLTTALPTGSVPIYHVYNAEEFAKVIQNNLH